MRGWHGPVWYAAASAWFHREVTLVRGGIAEVCRLHRVIQRVGIAEFTEGFFFHRAKDVRINGESAALCKMQRQDGKNIVMAGDACTLGDEFRG